jgi:hypothetical protein
VQEIADVQRCICDPTFAFNQSERLKSQLLAQQYLLDLFDDLSLLVAADFVEFIDMRQDILKISDLAAMAPSAIFATGAAPALNMGAAVLPFCASKPAASRPSASQA